ncbi:MAG TPA: arginine--tRNA ligase [Candidatus Poseidoniales archaeon]|nr:MAG TPA: arginine--tRNA ligase [Candidatus Poseidoniales archaeon]HIH56640.1 arginine--tRNA ligase [Candidatus Thalassarchaeum sp.]|tara:strand:+ start:960 stop:2696 length:1737 start_codon:yes stop_codon:yes gene_type:complete
MKILKQAVNDEVAEVLADAGAEGDLSELLGPATVEEHGDLALPCHSLAPLLKRSPVDIAESISSTLAPILAGIAEVSAVSGFVNIKAEPEWLAARLGDLLPDDRLGVAIEETRVAAVDYSAPNVAKEMHVGHLRSTVIGDAIVRMLMHKGHTVHRENHVGDWGTPFGMLIEHLLDLGEGNAADELGMGDLDGFYKQARGKFNSDEKFVERSRNRVVMLQSGDEETLRLWQVLVDESMRYFNEVYGMLGVLLTNDDIMGESNYHHLLPEVVTRLHDRGILEDSEGAKVVYPGGWVNREGEPMPLIIQKADGGYNYATTDLACIIDRVERLGCNDLLYVVGTPQTQHFKMVFEVAIQAGFMDDSHNAAHVKFGSVMDSDGKILKSREGQAIKLVDLLNEAVVRAEQAIAERNPSMEDEQRHKIAKTIGIGAVKYADLSTERSKDYVFDWERMLSFDGNTSPYLQYAHARICSIFRRSQIVRPLPRDTVISLGYEEEALLARRLINFSAMVDESLSTYSPHRMCTYLHSVASAFASFYENCPVLSSEDDGIRMSRLALCDITARTLSTGLGLLGIESPEQM